MNVVVMSRKKAEEYSAGEHWRKSIMISITDPGSNPSRTKKTEKNGLFSILRLSFEDNDSDDGMEDADAEKVCRFVNDNKDNAELLIVHCEAGISRSAGTAAAILKAIKGSDSQIFDDPYYHPNMRCYRKVLAAFYSNS